MKTLTIISHTEHFKQADGTIVGLGSTVTEVNHLLQIFDVIYHVAMLHKGLAPSSMLPYVSDKVIFVPLPAVGGKRISDKLAMIWKMPQIIWKIRQTIRKTTHFQFRAPTGIGVYVIPYLIGFSAKKGWFKYAGNWKQEDAPWTYRLQKSLLKKQSRKVTINGFWNSQPQHCLSFENPCLTETEVTEGRLTIAKKNLTANAVTWCFVGRLESAKGLDLLIIALHSLSDSQKVKIKTVHIVGDGAEKDKFQKMSQHCGIDIVFHGFLPRLDVHDIYKEAHAIILPSASEGFPKVIAEAMNYGCLPIVSNISSISHYITNKRHGFLLEDITVNALLKTMNTFLKLPNLEYRTMTKRNLENTEKYTYEHYNKRILTEIVDKPLK